MQKFAYSLTIFQTGTSSCQSHRFSHMTKYANPHTQSPQCACLLQQKWAVVLTSSCVLQSPLLGLPLVCLGQIPTSCTSCFWQMQAHLQTASRACSQQDTYTLHKQYAAECTCNPIGRHLSDLAYTCMPHNHVSKVTPSSSSSSSSSLFSTPAAGSATLLGCALRLPCAPTLLVLMLLLTSVSTTLPACAQTAKHTQVTNWLGVLDTIALRYGAITL